MKMKKVLDIFLELQKKIVINLLTDFCSNNPNIEIIFNLYDKNTEEIYKKYC